MALKYKFSSKDLKNLKFDDFKTYLLNLFKAFVPLKKIKNLKEVETFIQNKSAWVSQVTLYNYLKTRMGTRYVLHFDNEVFLASINKAKWNIYTVSLQDLTFYVFSYLNINFNYKGFNNAEIIYKKIINDEILNKMPTDIADKGIKTFQERLKKINWDIYYDSYPFNESALALYDWAPIADELKTLDRKIVLNSVILKWDIVKKEFLKRIHF
jgi:hypothetical protein|tara:strand:- start:807 stop:1442 length:636 start_codon:yes stop_codon:yes gene_type:complete